MSKIEILDETNNNFQVEMLIAKKIEVENIVPHFDKNNFYNGCEYVVDTLAEAEYADEMVQAMERFNVSCNQNMSIRELLYNYNLGEINFEIDILGSCSKSDKCIVLWLEMPKDIMPQIVYGEYDIQGLKQDGYNILEEIHRSDWRFDEHMLWRPTYKWIQLSFYKA
jgi:hypothetical protein